MEDATKVTNPEKFGSGMWKTIHILALDAKTPVKKRQFHKTMNVIVNGIMCKRCKKHALEYIATYPPSRCKVFKRNKIDISMFRWSWVFHNRVNERLGKDIVMFEDAYKLYTEGPEICTEGCSDEEENFSPPGVSIESKDKSHIDGYDLPISWPYGQ